MHPELQQAFRDIVMLSGLSNKEWDSKLWGVENNRTQLLTTFKAAFKDREEEKVKAAIKASKQAVRVYLAAAYPGLHGILSDEFKLPPSVIASWLRSTQLRAGREPELWSGDRGQYLVFRRIKTLDGANIKSGLRVEWLNVEAGRSDHGVAPFSMVRPLWGLKDRKITRPELIQTREIEGFIYATNEEFYSFGRIRHGTELRFSIMIPIFSTQGGTRRIDFLGVRSGSSNNVLGAPHPHVAFVYQLPRRVDLTPSEVVLRFGEISKKGAEELLKLFHVSDAKAEVDRIEESIAAEDKSHKWPDSVYPNIKIQFED